MLLGWGVGAAAGALYDADRLDTGDEAIEQFGALVPPGGNAVLAETVEDTTEPLDTFVSQMGGTIVRRPIDEVVAELEAQQAAAEEAEKAARKAIREQKKQERKETGQQRVKALKAKVPPAVANWHSAPPGRAGKPGSTPEVPQIDPPLLPAAP